MVKDVFMETTDVAFASAGVWARYKGLCFTGDVASVVALLQQTPGHQVMRLELQFVFLWAQLLSSVGVVAMDRLASPERNARRMNKARVQAFSDMRVKLGVFRKFWQSLGAAQKDRGAVAAAAAAAANVCSLVA